ncbi:centrosomal protein kizuna isoform X3 [Phycodurus eques]|uniref:centrosomal protein kizuna isoform X3 n=1 Tax=Phycodurus eques TaxID=693459 RepID=UPI002ACE99BB|nr:centrosomal protein kizuna isoform X3 [Phycodurus eques]
MWSAFKLTCNNTVLTFSLYNNKRFMEELKTTGNSKLKSVQGDCEDSSLSHIAEDFTNAPAVISMGHQTSRGAYHATGITSVLSHQALHCSPNRSMYSCKRLPSGPLKDFTVVGEEATANRAHLSDDISAPDNPADGHNLTDKHGKRLATLQFVQTATVPFVNDDEQEPEPQVTLRSSKRNPSLGSSNNPIGLQNPPAEHMNSTAIALATPLMENSARGFSRLKPETAAARKFEDISDLTVSTLALMMRRCRKAVLVTCPFLCRNPSRRMTSLRVKQLQGILDLMEVGAVPSQASRAHLTHSPWKDSLSLYTTLRGDSMVIKQECMGIVQLMKDNSFELSDLLHVRLTHGPRQWMAALYILDSLCDSEAGLNEEDLEACGAVVLHELQRLSLSTEKGGLLPQELVSAHPSSTEHITVSLPPDAARLWDRWFKHALLLKESRVLSTERLVELFAPLLVERHATYHHQAKVLLRTFLSRSSEECPSADEESDSTCSCGPPSLPLHCGDVKPARRIQEQQIQELQSAEEESHDESPVESVPIRETKAYQLLKLSAMQERLPSSEEEEEEEGEQDDASEINHGPEVDLGRAKCSSHQDPYPRKDKMNPKIYSALQSKELWGESDDSNSEIEAALRPQPFNTKDDDTDDFYD